MNEATLTRFEQTDEYTLGLLEFGDVELFTLELPWKNNEISVSCVPEGEYPCILRQSPKYGWKYWLQNTAPRSFVLIHGGNLVRHTQGCILPGKRQGVLHGEVAVLNSRAAVSELHAYFDNEPFDLVICNG